MKRQRILLMEFSLLTILAILYKALEYILDLNNLSLMNFPRHMFVGSFIILSFLILIQVVINISMSIKSKILKTSIIIISIIGGIFISLYTTLMVAFMYTPEHVVEKDNKKMVAYVNSFLQVQVSYYDYVNPFVRGTKLKIYEDYGNGGYDPFDCEEMPSVHRYYDDNGKVIKSNL